ncbi:MAG: DUF3095 domain-containing protein [Rhizobiaceae bacterium]|nr:DUF3095 domain-containing protein [Rhizobiaceae bacterium]
MDTIAPTGAFTDTLAPLSAFEGVIDPANYTPLPDGWLLATADIVGSTKAIGAGQYKSVNMAGASVISALLNALGRQDLPFVFGGDGALVAVPGEAREIAREALAATRRWVSDELGLQLRAALIPISNIRAAGLDVRVALFRPTEHVAYAMFSGGGASWAETEMKAGRYEVPAAPSGTRPDLTGLSCRWDPIRSQHGDIVSIIAVPVPGGDMRAFQDLVSEIIALAGAEDRAGHPVPSRGPDLVFSLAGVDREARAQAPAGKRFATKLGIVGQIALVWVLTKLGLKLGRFDPVVYARDVASNTDFRKFDDGLKMTVDLDAATTGAIEARLAEAERAGICRFGVHRQNSALMTCIVATPLHRDHMHFVDGAAGGYAVAAANLKAKAA